MRQWRNHQLHRRRGIESTERLGNPRWIFGPVPGPARLPTADATNESDATPVPHSLACAVVIHAANSPTETCSEVGVLARISSLDCGQSVNHDDCETLPARCADGTADNGSGSLTSASDAGRHLPEFL